MLKRARRVPIRGAVVVITGAGSGIGRLMAHGAANRGAKAVLVWDLNEAAARAVAEEIGHAALAQAVMRLTGSPCRVNPIPSTDYPSAARRPLNSRLGMRSLDQAGFARLPHWEDALQRYLRQMHLIP